MRSLFLMAAGSVLILGVLSACGTSGVDKAQDSGSGSSVTVGGGDGWWVDAPTGARRETPVVSEVVPAASEPMDGQKLPYGLKEGGKLKSPYSDFQVKSGGRKTGEKVLDIYSNKYFLVP